MKRNVAMKGRAENVNANSVGVLPPGRHSPQSSSSDSIGEEIESSEPLHIHTLYIVGLEL